jgi:hypothetical protein
MSLDHSKLNKLVRLNGGGFRAQCPACAEIGQDRSGQHLYIFPDGRFGCAAYQQDHAHRQRISALANGADLKPMQRAPRPEPEFVLNVPEAMAQFRKGAQRSLNILATQLGVSASALLAMGVCWAGPYSAWAFPMFNGYGQPIGVQLRSDAGVKWCVKGSHGGIFLPTGHTERMALLPEGASGTAAALTLGYCAIGRFNATAGMQHVKIALGRNRISRAIIIADNDEDRTGNGRISNAGTDGALSLARQIPIPTAILVLPVKDLREFLNLGGDAHLLNQLIDELVWSTKENNDSTSNSGTVCTCQGKVCQS